LSGKTNRSLTQFHFKFNAGTHNTRNKKTLQNTFHCLADKNKTLTLSCDDFDDVSDHDDDDGDVDSQTTNLTE